MNNLLVHLFVFLGGGHSSRLVPHPLHETRARSVLISEHLN